jgi:anti-sigma regulatory factor (Ser/Thr protein kinase)
MQSDELRLEPLLSEIPRLIEWVEARCAAAGVAGEIAMKLALVLEEAVANVIQHGLPGSQPPHRITVRLDIDADSVAADVTTTEARSTRPALHRPTCRCRSNSGLRAVSVST